MFNRHYLLKDFPVSVLRPKMRKTLAHPTVVEDGSRSVVETNRLSYHHFMYLYKIYFVPIVCRVLEKGLETQNSKAKTLRVPFYHLLSPIQ